MTDFIDLSEWNEYIADDVSPGPIPCGVVIDTMQITTATCYKEPPAHDYPVGLKSNMESIKVRFFWRLVRDR